MRRLAIGFFTPALLAVALLAVGCDDGRRVGTTDGEIPWVDAGPGGCVPATCADRGAQCGQVSDGCGGVLDCGGCVAGETCGAGGANQCAVGTCVTQTCASLEAQCGRPSDGCAAVLDCGTCALGLSCGADNRCGTDTCTPTTCAALGATCGAPDDGCGGVLSCGGCDAGATCGLEASFTCGGECTDDAHCPEAQTCDTSTSVCVDRCVGPSADVVVDVPFVDVSPEVTLGGVALAPFVGEDYTNGSPLLRFVNELGSFGFPLYEYDTSVSGGYRYRPNTATLRIVPGIYEVRYDAQVTEVDGFEVFPITDAVLVATLEVTADGALTVDIPYVDVSPNVTLGGGALAAFVGEDYTNGSPMARFVNELGSFGFPLYAYDTSVSGGYRYRPNTALLRVVPGTYEVRYDAQVTEVDGFEIFPITDAVLIAERVVSAGTLSLDIPYVDVSPNVTLGGAALASFVGEDYTNGSPLVRFVNGLGSFGFPLYEYDTSVSGGYQYRPNTALLRVVPGTYEVRYDAQVTEVDGFEIFPITDAVLIAERVVSTGTLSVDIPFADVSPNVTLGGATLAVFVGEDYTNGSPLVRFVNGLGSFGFPLYEYDTSVSGGYRYRPNTALLRVVPGTYEVRYDAQVTEVDGFEIFPITDAVLIAERVVSAGTLSLDIPYVDVSPNVTLGGAALASFVGEDYTNGSPLVRFVNGLGSFGFPLYEYDTSVSGGYQYRPNTATLRVVPGTYEVRYDAQVTEVDGFEIFPITDAVLIAERVVSAGTLSVDIPYLDVSPDVTLGGAALAVFVGEDYTNGSPLVRFVNGLGSFGFPLYEYDTSVSGGYQYRPNTATLRVVPGTYEVRYDAQVTEVDGFEIFPITDAVLFCQHIARP